MFKLNFMNKIYKFIWQLIFSHQNIEALKKNAYIEKN